MAIQHRDITEANLHENKGASSAPAGSMLKATGAGTSTWDKVGIENLKGVGAPAVGNRLVVGSAGSISSITDFSVGSMVITDNLNGFIMTAATDSTLRTNSDYKLFTGNGAPWAAGSVMDKTSFTTDRLTVTVAGIYRVEAWTDIAGFPTNAATIALKYRLNGVTFSERKAQVKSNSGGDSGGINAFSILALAAGDYIQVLFASSANGNLLVSSMNVSATLLKAT